MRERRCDACQQPARNLDDRGFCEDCRGTDEDYWMEDWEGV